MRATLSTYSLNTHQKAPATSSPEEKLQAAFVVSVLDDVQWASGADFASAWHETYCVDGFENVVAFVGYHIDQVRAHNLEVMRTRASICNIGDQTSVGDYSPNDESWETVLLGALIYHHSINAALVRENERLKKLQREAYERNHQARARLHRLVQRLRGLVDSCRLPLSVEEDVREMVKTYSRKTPSEKVTDSENPRPPSHETSS